MFKYGFETQEVHFGDSHQHATLYTGLSHTKTTMIFSHSISSSMHRDPISAYLNDIMLPYLKELITATTLHVISNRLAFFLSLLSKAPFQMGFQRITWNFLEAGHGKGLGDGIGAAVKWQANSLAKGTDFPNKREMYFWPHTP